MAFPHTLLLVDEPTNLSSTYSLLFWVFSWNIGINMVPTSRDNTKSKNPIRCLVQCAIDYHWARRLSLPSYLAIAQELSDLPDSACEVGKGYSFWFTGQDFVWPWLCPQGLVQC